MVDEKTNGTGGRNGVFLAHCLTPLHNGAGQGLGAIDRPVLRESTTGFPYVQSSSLKGALRFEGEILKQSKLDPTVTMLFGEGESGGAMGCLSLTDPMLLLLPVRSLAGVFAWVTCPLVLSRFLRLLEMVRPVSGLMAPTLALRDAVKGLGRGGAHGTTRTQVKIQVNKFVLEGLVLTPAEKEERLLLDAWVTSLPAFAAKGFWQDWALHHTCVISDEDFTHLVTHALPVEANIQIGDTGVTTDGSLRYTEFLPAETILAGYWQVDEPRKQSSETLVNLEILWGQVARSLRQLGADESKGRGLIAMAVTPTPPGPPSKEGRK